VVFEIETYNNLGRIGHSRIQIRTIFFGQEEISTNGRDVYVLGGVIMKWRRHTEQAHHMSSFSLVTCPDFLATIKALLTCPKQTPIPQTMFGCAVVVVRRTIPATTQPLPAHLESHGRINSPTLHSPKLVLLFQTEPEPFTRWSGIPLLVLRRLQEKNLFKTNCHWIAILFQC
jgi:hypothetical protein